MWQRRGCQKSHSVSSSLTESTMAKMIGRTQYEIETDTYGFTIHRRVAKRREQREWMRYEQNDQGKETEVV